MVSNSIMEALAKPAGSREVLARDLAGHCQEEARVALERAANFSGATGVDYYLAALEWEAKAARILQSILFQREPEFSRSEREALLRLIGGDE